ncbi:aminoacyl-tRNA deacylase [Labilibaculum filiforme]|uniref:Cys-tRNA(Pro)/Cys-tRNA(Cys) deacylase n=1 Tax=Labilibaculum filiforme TaxID=1940526 RepID=A0A2N3I6B5_9BACT|nr:Cys-tRNA(Pro) deacylase [Labilibaculum filiforme]PKQ65847.1 aminoacyl-tRNA deacylase [Labilibaculum filiforme]
MKKTNAARILDRAKIEYEIIDYDVDPIELGAERVAEKTGQHIQFIYKTLVLTGDKTGTTIACIPGASELDLKAFAILSGNKKCAMLPMKDILEITGYIRGGCSPLGMKKDFPLFIDESAFKLDHILISAGLRGKQLKVKPQDIQKVTNAKTGNLSTPKSSLA